jgi:hypothetical protein
VVAKKHVSNVVVVHKGKLKALNLKEEVVD